MLKNLNHIKRNNANVLSRYKLLRLDKNERTSKFPKKFIKLLKKKLTSENLLVYPEYSLFYKLLSREHGLKTDYFLCTAGIDYGLRNCIELFGNKKILVLNPTFAMIDVYCKIYKKKIIKINYNKNVELNKKKLFNSISNKLSLIIISNPNSPTGTFLKLNEIKKILIQAKKFNIKVAIDEAYYGFSHITVFPLLKKNKNLIILRTFSKAFGLAGLRIGYIISNPKNVQLFKKIKPMYEVNSFAILAATFLLRDKTIKNHYLKEVEEGKKFIKEFFYKKKIEYRESNTNFILFKLALKKKKKYFQRLKINNINIVEKIQYKNLNDYSRITLGPKKQMQKFAKIFKDY